MMTNSMASRSSMEPQHSAQLSASQMVMPEDYLNIWYDQSTLKRLLQEVHTCVVCLSTNAFVSIRFPICAAHISILNEIFSQTKIRLKLNSSFNSLKFRYLQWIPNRQPSKMNRSHPRIERNTYAEKDLFESRSNLCYKIKCTIWVLVSLGARFDVRLVLIWWKTWNKSFRFYQSQNLVVLIFKFQEPRIG